MILNTRQRNRGVMNKSYSYLLPLFNEECPVNGHFYILLKNVFCRYEGQDGFFVLCYEDAKNDGFNEYIAILHEHKLFVESYTEEDFIYVVFKFPESFKYEYNCYMKGRFSKFRDSAKLIVVGYILSVHGNASAEKIRKVLYKDPSLKLSMESLLGCTLGDDIELSSKPILASETCFNFSDVKNE